MFLRFEIPLTLLRIVDHIQKLQAIKTKIVNCFIWCYLEQAKVLSQILSPIAAEKDCLLACDDLNLCTNYTYLGPENPLR